MPHLVPWLLAVSSIALAHIAPACSDSSGTPVPADAPAKNASGGAGAADASVPEGGASVPGSAGATPVASGAGGSGPVSGKDGGDGESEPPSFPDDGGDTLAQNSGRICTRPSECSNPHDRCVGLIAEATSGMCLSECSQAADDCHVVDKAAQLSLCILQLPDAGGSRCAWLCEHAAKSYLCPDSQNYDCVVLDPAHPDTKVCTPKHDNPLPDGGPRDGSEPQTDSIDILHGKPPTIDGIIAPGEWTDAAALTIEVASGWTVTVYYKHDGANINLAFSNLTHDGQERYPEVVLNVGGSASSSWSSDDWWFHASYNDCEGNGSPNNYSDCVATASGWSANNFPLGAAGVVEMRIGYGKFGFAPGAGKRLGIALDVTDCTEQWNFWPSTASLDSPSSWGTATSSDNWAAP